MSVAFKQDTERRVEMPVKTHLKYSTRTKEPAKQCAQLAQQAAQRSTGDIKHCTKEPSKRCLYKHRDTNRHIKELDRRCAQTVLLAGDDGSCYVPGATGNGIFFNVVYDRFCLLASNTGDGIYSNNTFSSLEPLHTGNGIYSNASGDGSYYVPGYVPGDQGNGILRRHGQRLPLSPWRHRRHHLLQRYRQLRESNNPSEHRLGPRLESQEKDATEVNWLIHGSVLHR